MRLNTLSRFRVIFILLSVLLSFNSGAKETVQVALTSIQPPFVFDNKELKGLVNDVFTELNRAQERYHFELALYPPSRLRQYFDSMQVHIIAFNDENWGWKPLGGQGSLPLTRGKDLFFQLAEPHKEANDRLVDIAAVRGFHYRFANFDPSYLEHNEEIAVLENEAAVVKFVSYGRAKRGISSEAYLNWLSLSQPHVYDRLQILNADHRYQRKLVVMPASPVSVEEIDDYLRTLSKSGLLNKIFDRYGQLPPPLE